MSNQKLLYANIKIPVELSGDGSINPLKDYIDVEFTPCISLPEIKKNVDYSFVMNKLSFFMKNEAAQPEPLIEEEVEPEPLIEEEVEPEKIIRIAKEDIKTSHSRPVNSSFKKRQYNHRHTIKQN
jgi:hypothetical protein